MLRQRLFFASPEDQAEIKLEIKVVRKKYRALRKATDHNFYFAVDDGDFDPEG